MASKDIATLRTQAQQIRDETAIGANTALRVGEMHEDQNDSALNIVEASDQTLASSLQVDKQLRVKGSIRPFAAAASFDMDNGNEQEMTLTSNVTSLSLTKKKSPASYRIYLIQDAGGGNTIPDPDSTFGTKTTNSADFITTGNAINIIDIAVSPSGKTMYSIETVEP